MIEEAIGTKLNCPLEVNIKYSFSVDIAGREIYIPKNEGVLQIYGSESYCFRDQLLFESPLIDSVWRKYFASFTTTKKISYLSFNVKATKLIGNSSFYIFVDNLSPIQIDSGYTNVRIEASASAIEIGNNINLSCKFTQGTSNDYKIVWTSSDPAFLETSRTLQVQPNKNTTYFVKATDSCGYYSYDSIQIIVTNPYCFPNPATSTLTLNLPNKAAEKIPELKIYDAIGRLKPVSIIANENNKATLDISKFAAGMYIVFATYHNELHKFKFEKIQ